MRTIFDVRVHAMRAFTKSIFHKDGCAEHLATRRAFGIGALGMLLACLIATATMAAGADDVGTAQSIIRSQEEAFARDDAAAAYGFAAPGLQHYFQNPDGFMAMVRNGYAPVYRHRSFDFGESEIVDGKIVQDVQIIDADGVAWDALYTLETQPDGSLKISACILKKAVISRLRLLTEPQGKRRRMPRGLICRRVVSPTIVRHIATRPTLDHSDVRGDRQARG
jgi:hypothetical protein